MQLSTPTPTPKLLPQALLAHWSRVLQRCLGQTEQAVGDMLQTVAEMGTRWPTAAQGADLLERLNEGLQYQDRQRQTLELLLADLNAAMALSNEQGGALDMDAWLDHFDSHCPIPELRRGAATLPGALTRQGESGLEFF